MNTFEFNKLAGALLFTLLALFIIGTVGNAVMEAPALEQSAYVVEGVEETAAVASEAVAEEPLGVLLAAADVGKGEKVAKKCVSCHTFEQGGKNKIGPNLWSIIGRDRATVEGFGYSSALTDAGGGWGYEELDAYLKKPAEALPGNKMTFAGLRKAQDRANIIAFLRTQSDSPPPLPPAE